MGSDYSTIRGKQTKKQIIVLFIAVAIMEVGRVLVVG
jgi:hypothetical protein